MHWRNPHLLAGRDEVAGGTWFGLTSTGRVAWVTNIRNGQRERHSMLRSRGELTQQFLESELSVGDYLHAVSARREEFGGFNLVCGEIAGANPALWFLNAHEATPRELPHGRYVLSNATLDTPWPKVEKLRRALPEAAEDASEQTALAALFDAERASPAQLPSTGVPLEWEHALSPVFIREGATLGYGTRSTTLLRASATGACVREYTHTPDTVGAHSVSFDFDWIAR